MLVLLKLLGGMAVIALGTGCVASGEKQNSRSSAEVASITSASPAPSSQVTTTSDVGTTSPSVLPDPPPAMALVGTPQEQSIQLADAFERGDETRSSALIAAFDAAGIAVIDSQERSLISSAVTVGIPWLFIYAVSTAPNHNARLSLSELAKFFAADGIEPRLNTELVAADLVNGLRAALAEDSSVPGPARVALLVQEEARRAGGVDLADPSVTADQVKVSIQTAALLLSAGVLVATSSQTRAAPPTDSTVSGLVGMMASGLPPGCATDAASQWALWLVSKILTGAEIPGMTFGNPLQGGFQGVFGELIMHLHDFYPKGVPPSVTKLQDQLKRVATGAGFAAAAMTALSAFVAALTYGADVSLKDGEPLVRTKSSGGDGRPGTIVVKVGFDYGQLDTKTVNAINCLLAVLVVAGNNSTVPPPGPAKGVSVTIAGEEGFGQGLITEGSFVVLNMPLTKDTDDAGVAEFSVGGRRQRVDIPKSVPPVDRVFSVSVEAQPDPTDLDSLSKTFLDSFLCGGAIISQKPLACVDAIADIVRQTKWDLGTWRFRLTDWMQDYKV